MYRLRPSTRWFRFMIGSSAAWPVHSQTLRPSLKLRSFIFHSTGAHRQNNPQLNSQTCLYSFTSRTLIFHLYKCIKNVSALLALLQCPDGEPSAGDSSSICAEGAVLQKQRGAAGRLHHSRLGPEERTSGRQWGWLVVHRVSLQGWCSPSLSRCTLCLWVGC